MTRLITATYRLQLRRDFPFSTVRALVPYFDRLGVSHLYLSPVLAARPGSPHGYDVTDPARVNPELGTEDELRALADALHARGMGIVLDIVPNHMAASEQNPHWDDVLQRGRASRYAEWFDIDWDAPRAKQKIVLPALSDELEAVIERGELTLRIRDSGARVAYHERTFPLDAATLPKEVQLAQLDPAGRPAADAWASGPDGKARFRVMLNAQHYRLVHWRQTKDINYRRFFDVNDLVALRMDTDAVFDETHRLILSWVRDGVVDGLRVDHVDGLCAPSWYLGKLRTAVDAARHPDAPERFPLYVEKILAGDEALPSDWAVDGTTGYDFMNDVEDLFLDESGFGAIEANYRGLRHNPSLGFRAVARDGKRRALTSSLEPDVMRAARVAHAWRASVSLDDVASAITELIVHLDVYRTYVGEPGVVSETDRPRLEAAFRGAMESEGANRAALELLQSAFFASPSAADAQRAELVSRVQLASGPAAAKGIEDTALYVYVPLASRNEVGGEPDRPLGEAAARAHARNTARARDWPGALIATNTHDTKRSGDLRARLDVLTGVPDEWGRHVARWRRLNKPRKRIARGRPAPDTNSEYMFYQALLGVWPAPRPERRADDLPDRAWIAGVCDRLVEYMLKAAREAKTRTSWTESDTQYERALEAFVREALAPSDDAPFLPDVARLTALVADRGFGVSLARLLLHCTAPGCPDFYQGDELWSFTLVDPDNRRPVDFALRARLLESLDAPAVLRAAFAGELALLDPRVKLAAVERLLRFRRDNGTLLASGDYLPILGASAAATGLFAFARRSRHGVCISIARTRMPLPNAQAIEGQSLELPGELAGRWRSIFTGREIELVGKGSSLKVDAGDLVAPRQPCELLLRDNG